MELCLDFFYRVEHIDPLEYYYNYVIKAIVVECDQPMKIDNINFLGLIDHPDFIQYEKFVCICVDDECCCEREGVKESEAIRKVVKEELGHAAVDAVFDLLSKEFTLLISTSVNLNHEINKMSDVGLDILRQLICNEAPKEYTEKILKMVSSEFRDYIINTDSVPLKDNLLWNIGFDSIAEITFKWNDKILYDIRFFSEDLIVGYTAMKIENEYKIVFKYKNEIQSTEDTPDDLRLRQEHFYIYRNLM